MKQDCFFDKSKDLRQTVPGLSVSLQLALESGQIMDTGVNSEFNLIEQPGSVVCRIRDSFEAIDLQRSIMRNAAASSSSETQTAQTSTNVSVNPPEGAQV